MKTLEDWEKVVVLLYLSQKQEMPPFTNGSHENLAQSLFDWPKERAEAAFAEAHLRGMSEPT